ncbi:MAG: hypothetical protein ACK56I_15690, partial [bacterium]
MPCEEIRSLGGLVPGLPAGPRGLPGAGAGGRPREVAGGEDGVEVLGQLLRHHHGEGLFQDREMEEVFVDPAALERDVNRRLPPVPGEHAPGPGAALEGGAAGRSVGPEPRGQDAGQD